MRLKTVINKINKTYGPIAERADKVVKRRQKKYASALTKEELIKMGIVSIDLDNLIVYGQNGPFSIVKHRQGYLMIQVYDLDENGNRIKLPHTIYYNAIDGTRHAYNAYIYKTRLIGLHRILWAWKYGKVEAGMVVDHINNKHDELEDYRFDNLQCITPAENIAKERNNYNKRIVVNKKKGIQFYQDKLNRLNEEYEIAKLNKDQIEAHKLRSKISHTKGCIRYLVMQGK